MKELIFVIAIAIAVNSSAFAQTQMASIATISTQMPPAKRPDWKPGEQWLYEYRNSRHGKPPCNYMLTVKEVSDKIQGAIDFPGHCDLDMLGSAPVYDLDFNLEFPGGMAFHALNFPLEVGKTWRQNLDYTLGTMNWHNEAEMRIVSFGKVSTPAGTFDAYEIRIVSNNVGNSTRNTYQWKGTVMETRWWSPQVKNYVTRTVSNNKSVETVQYTLLGFKVQ